MKLFVVLHSLALTLLGSAWGLLAGTASFPKDPEDTLNRVLQARTLRVGYTHAEPWVVPSGAEPQGIEPELVRAFAQTLGARVAWVAGTEQHLYQALEQHELDLLIAGTTAESPWKEQVGLTRPYLETAVYVGSAPGVMVGADIKDRTVAVAAGTDIGHYVREEDAVPTYRPQLPDGVPLAAGYAWQLRRWGYRNLGIRLKDESHVMAVPPGENAWLLALETFLYRHKAQVNRLLH